jgi:hypothetical protein
MPTNTRASSIIVGITLAALATNIIACNLVVDAPDAPVEGSETGGPGDSGECLEAVEPIQSMCMPPQQLFLMWEQAAMVPLDDPGASVELAPGGWLVEVTGSDYVGSQHFGNGTCTVGCGWCQPGQSLCHTGLDENGSLGCMFCIPAGIDDPEVQCAQFLDACFGAGEAGSEATGTGDTGSEPGFDETGSDSMGSGDTGSDDGPDETGSDELTSSSTGLEPGLDETGS